MGSRLALLPIGLFVLWCVVCQQWYVCHIKQVCASKTVVQPPPTSDTDNRPVVFSWGEPDPETRPSWATFRDSIVAQLTGGKLLEITGLYHKGESAPKGFANMGLARAAKLKDLLLAQVKGLQSEQITTTSRMVDSPAKESATKFEAAEFRIKDVPKGDEVEIVEVDNTITILFPYAKSTKEPDPRVDEYLEKLAARLAKTDETVSITGHTDDSGTAENNMTLGLSRANHIKSILVGKGIAEGRLSVASKGESEPVADNNTEEGSRLNRRAVLVLNRKNPG